MNCVRLSRFLQPSSSNNIPLEFQLKADFPAHKPAIHHTDKIMLLGSCFTEHISKRLQDAKFEVLANPHGILFNPLSVCHSLDAYIDSKVYDKSELFYLNEIYNSWDFHTRFSETNADIALAQMNESVAAAAAFIREADWLIITLGSAYQYFLTEEKGGVSVANCHRAPGQWFDKRLLDTDIIVAELKRVTARLKAINPCLKIIFTISPVRHIRDGVVNNNRSKARLIEAVHQIVDEMPDCSYFPAYELIIDVLRDYRFYDIDMVHPNYPATQFVWEHFSKVFFEEDTAQLIRQITELTIARNHKSRFPDTDVHRRFLEGNVTKIQQLLEGFPYLDFKEEMGYFKK